MNDWIEVGALAAPEKGKKYGKVLHRERVHMTTAKSTYTFTTDTLPEKAGIDPAIAADRSCAGRQPGECYGQIRKSFGSESV